MPNIFHLNRWKLQRRDGASVGGEMERKGQEEKDDGWGGGGRVRAFLCVHASLCGTDQKYLNSNEYTVVNPAA